MPQRAWLESRVQDMLVHHDISYERAEDLVELLSSATSARISTGDVLCREGEPADAVYVLLEGRVGVMLRGVDGEERELSQLAAPALVGHVGMLDGADRCATYVALLPTTVVTLPRTRCESLLDRPSGPGATFRHLLVSSMSQQLAARNQRLRAVMARIGKEPAPSSGSARDRRSRRSVWSLRDHGPAEETEADVLEMAGLTEGWDVDTRGVDRISSVEDEAMKRSRLGKRSK